MRHVGKETSDGIASALKAAPSPAPIRLLLTIPEAAASLGVSRSLVYELVQVGTIVTIKIGRSRRVPVAALEDFIAQQLQRQGE
jgi:excisionase family DNA binding protein